MARTRNTAAESGGVTPMSYQILVALAGGELHGYAIIKDIEERNGEGSVASTGALYLALQRLEASGLIEGIRRANGEDARRRYYRLTEAGREVAMEETARLARLLGTAQERRLIAARQLSKLMPGGGHAR